MDAIFSFFTILLFLVPLGIFLFTKRSSKPRNLPPGSLGIPIIGQSLNLLRAMRANKAEEWLQKRVQKYGPVSKLSLFGKPTVFIYGQAANKFVFSSDSSMLSNHQPQSVKTILGERNLLELSGHDHKRVREALMLFLRPDSLKKYVASIDQEVKLHIRMYWQNKQEVTVLPLMKTLTFNIICTVLFGIERGVRRDKLVDWFQRLILGMWSIPINLPLTRYNQSLRARASIEKMVKQLLKEKRQQLEENGANPHQDLITSMLSGQEMSETEIVDNIVLIMTAGHDTSSAVLTLLVRLFGDQPSIYESVLQEQEEIAKNKSNGVSLTWEDLAKMKYTWRVVNETLRVFPPIFGGFRTTVRDIEYEGYTIPKGWQVFWVTGMTHMDNIIFPEPDKFDPSRFENPSSVAPYCFIPFGGGPRICPGYEFAKIEILVAIHYLVTQFTWTLCADNQFKRDPMPVPTKGLPIKIVVREPSTTT